MNGRPMSFIVTCAVAALCRPRTRRLLEQADFHLTTFQDYVPLDGSLALCKPKSLAIQSQAFINAGDVNRHGVLHPATLLVNCPVTNQAIDIPV